MHGACSSSSAPPDCLEPPSPASPRATSPRSTRPTSTRSCCASTPRTTWPPTCAPRCLAVSPWRSCTSWRRRPSARCRPPLTRWTPGARRLKATPPRQPSRRTTAGTSCSPAVPLPRLLPFRPVGVCRAASRPPARPWTPLALPPAPPGQLLPRCSRQLQPIAAPPSVAGVASPQSPRPSAAIPPRRHRQRALARRRPRAQPAHPRRLPRRTVPPLPRQAATPPRTPAGRSLPAARMLGPLRPRQLAQ
mmetsp:Transcript_8379/g.33070  ORF Transcript_8379/g.33070 Transcript_8379/m.33070 type:complete len:248 (+) Transcript_8379:696-1439(+)